MTKSTGSAAKLVQNIADAVSGVQETAGQVSRHTADKIDAIRETVAGTTDETSSELSRAASKSRKLPKLPLKRSKTARNMFAKRICGIWVLMSKASQNDTR